MQHSNEELLYQAKLIKRAYRSFTHIVDGVEFLYEVHPDRQYLAFKGTSSNTGRWPVLSFLWDVLTDVRFIPRKDSSYGFGRHPSGFMESAEDLVGYIFGPDAPINTKKPTHLCGHSLGGAVLLIAAPVLAAHGMDIRSTVTFGAPNVGRLAVSHKTRVTCLRNGHDIITEIPPIYGDTHRTTRIVKKNVSGFPRRYISDHRLDSYIEGIKDIQNGRAFYAR